MAPVILPISVTILTKNSARYLHEVLSALQNFAEVIIYDNGSADETLAIAQQFSNVNIHQGNFVGFGPTHNIASGLAKHDWILSIDSDEVATPELIQEISFIKLDPQKVYKISRKNYYNGRWIRGCGWNPDYQIKLYNRLSTRFNDAKVHEAVIAEPSQIITLRSPVIHYPYANTADFLHKMQIYSTLFADQYAGKKKASIWTAIGHGLFAFFKTYFLKKGFLDGREGFIISIYNGNTAFYKYLKLWERRVMSDEQ